MSSNMYMHVFMALCRTGDKNEDSVSALLHVSLF